MDGLSRLQSEACRDLVRAQHFFVRLVRYGARFDDSPDFLRTPRRLRDQPDRLDLVVWQPGGLVPCKERPRRCQRTPYCVRTRDQRVDHVGTQIGCCGAQHVDECLSVLRRCRGHDGSHALPLLCRRWSTLSRSVKIGTPSLAAGPSDGCWASRVLRGRTRSVALQISACAVNKLPDGLSACAVDKPVCSGRVWSVSDQVVPFAALEAFDELRLLH